MGHDVLILGSGPAGTSAAIYTGRGGLDTLVVSHGRSTLLWAGRIDNYFGFPDGIQGTELYEKALTQAKKYGASFLDDEVVALEKSDSGIKLIGVNGEYAGKTLLLATGNPPKKTHLKNAERFEGTGIAYCASCDGFFYRDMKVGVLGHSDYAVQEALELLDYTKNITIFTNGREMVLSGKYAGAAGEFKVDPRKIGSLEGGDVLEKIVFSGGEEENIQGLFIASGSASSVDFAKKTGILTEGSYIVVDNDQMTNIGGIFAAGACTNSCMTVNQVATSVGQGALAGKKILEYLGRSAAERYNIR
jgi:thioredoxin reductase (NADPH)